MFGKITRFHSSKLVEVEIIAAELPATMPTTSDGIDNLGSGYTLAPGSTMIVTETDKQYILGTDETWEEFSTGGGGGDLSAYQTKALSSSVTIGGETETTVEGAIGAVADVIPNTAASGNKLAAQDNVNVMFQTMMPNNEIIYDSAGKPSVMYKLPKMSWKELGIGTSTDTFPAWIINGQEVDYIYISKYQNIVSDGKAYSLPGKDPAANITFDDAVNACSAKGGGWHVTTRLEWMVVALLCLRNGKLPNGNNDYGKDASETSYVAIPSCPLDEQGRIQRVQTGTGPLTWSHNGLPSGIFDLNGNVNERMGGIRFYNGELQVISKDGITFGNDAADPNNSQAADSNKWYAIDGTDGTLITPNGSGTTTNSLKLSWVSSNWKWTTGNASTGSHLGKFENITVDNTVSSEAQYLLMALGLLKSNNTEGIYNDVIIYIDLSAERPVASGGAWGSGNSESGLFRMYAPYLRSTTKETLGFRSTYTPIPTGV